MIATYQQENTFTTSSFVIAVLFETDRRIQTQCLKLIYCPYASDYVLADDEDADGWLEVGRKRIDFEIQEGIVRGVDELSLLFHSAIDECE